MRNFILIIVLIFLLGCSTGKYAKNQTNPQLGYTTSGNVTNISSQGDTVIGNKTVNEGGIKSFNKEIIKDKINNLIVDSDIKIDKLYKKGEYKLAGAREKAVRQQGRSSGLLIIVTLNNIEEINIKLDDELRLLNKKIKEILYEINETELEDVLFLIDELKKYNLLIDKKEALIKDLRNKY